MYWISKDISATTLSILHLQDFYKVARKLLMSCNRVVTTVKDENQYSPIPILCEAG